MTATVRWILIVIALLVSNALAMGYLVLASSSSRPDVIPDYYARSAAFDQEIDQATKNRALGWRVDARAGMSLEIRDAVGAPLTGARVRVSATARADGRTTEVELVEHDGRYVAPHPARGLEDLAIVVDRGGERFTAHAIVE
jgi:nitrogen fixation protein FixH